jgi:hypothetical protein
MITEILITSILLNVIGTIILIRNLLKVEPKQVGTYFFGEDEIKERQLKENIKAKKRFYLNWFGFILNIIATLLQVYVIDYPR